MTLRVEKHAGHWSILLDRPEKHNALNAELVEALIETVDAAADARADLISFQGQGRCFSAGFDMSEVEKYSEGDLLLRFVRIETLLQKVHASPCKTVALVHGRNFGAGVDLLAACKTRVATPDASFRMPGLKFGLVLGSRRFAQIVGVEAARNILECCATFTSEVGLSNGFISQVAPAEQWPQLMTELVEQSAALDWQGRALLYQVLGSGGEDADLADLVRSAARPGLKERIHAYLNPNAQ
jgi:enoyl-CoA hydratase